MLRYDRSGGKFTSQKLANTRLRQFYGRNTKMRIYFLQNVSHSAAHYRRSEAREFERTLLRGVIKEERYGEQRKREGKRERGEGGEKRGSCRAEHFVKQGKMLVRREAQPQHFCLYKIMYSAGLRHISQNITSFLCVPRLLLLPSSFSLDLFSFAIALVSSFLPSMAFNKWKVPPILFTFTFTTRIKFPYFYYQLVKFNIRKLKQFGTSIIQEFVSLFIYVCLICFDSPNIRGVTFSPFAFYLLSGLCIES